MNFRSGTAGIVRVDESMNELESHPLFMSDYHFTTTCQGRVLQAWW